MAGHPREADAPAQRRAREQFVDDVDGQIGAFESIHELARDQRARDQLVEQQRLLDVCAADVRRSLGNGLLTVRQRAGERPGAGREEARSNRPQAHAPAGAIPGPSGSALRRPDQTGFRGRRRGATRHRPRRRLSDFRQVRGLAAAGRGRGGAGSDRQRVRQSPTRRLCRCSGSPAATAPCSPIARITRRWSAADRCAREADVVEADDRTSSGTRSRGAWPSPPPIAISSLKQKIAVGSTLRRAAARADGARLDREIAVHHDEVVSAFCCWRAVAPRKDHG